MSELETQADLRVLIVDDDVDAATSFSYVLQILGCKTAVAFGATMGLRVAQLFQPNLCFVDLGMPGCDGLETVHALREIEGPVSSAMFVCLTGCKGPDEEQRCLDAGFDHFITKPMDSKVLPDLLEMARQRVAALDALTQTRQPELPVA